MSTIPILLQDAGLAQTVLTETKAMSWIEFSIKTSAENAEPWEEWLLSVGADAVTLRDAADQPVYEPKPGETQLWAQTEVIGLFPGDIELSTILIQLQFYCSDEPIPKYKIRHLADEAWSEKWKEYVEPIHIDDHFWISPPALVNAIDDPHANILLLEPGLAFGTGAHHTTHLCLQAIIANRNQFNEKLIIDYGCGSGILGIAALKLGAQHVIATDISEQALQATQQNALLNHFSDDKITLAKPAEIAVDNPCDILLANILANPLIELAETFTQLLKPQGLLILSGLLETDADRVLAAYQENFECKRQDQDDEWLCLTLLRL